LCGSLTSNTEGTVEVDAGSKAQNKACVIKHCKRCKLESVCVGVRTALHSMGSWGPKNGSK